ncbi:unnamed protein product [Brachionus calyciflorus]|uniref:Uncharacterized protein n=1 Tax=Brachionus calyciflorus TaxID=104777 RepID=A0A814PA51_9BILA|nr:unnamed protein product [Brachionus calyciflorus]
MPNDMKCNKLLEYFENTWMKDIKPEVWNHDNSDMRTNNIIEVFHSGLNKLHPNTFTLIKYLKQQQSTVLIDYERVKQDQWFDDNNFSDTDDDEDTNDAQNINNNGVNIQHQQENLVYANLETVQVLETNFNLNDEQPGPSTRIPLAVRFADLDFVDLSDESFNYLENVLWKVSSRCV